MIVKVNDGDDEVIGIMIEKFGRRLGKDGA